MGFFSARPIVIELLEGLGYEAVMDILPSPCTALNGINKCCVSADVDAADVCPPDCAMVSGRSSALSGAAKMFLQPDGAWACCR